MLFLIPAVGFLKGQKAGVPGINCMNRIVVIPIVRCHFCGIGCDDGFAVAKGLYSIRMKVIVNESDFIELVIQGR